MPATPAPPSPRTATHSDPVEPAAAVEAPVVSAEGLGKAYGPQRVLDDVSLALRPGDALLVRGRSGSGKSTLLHLLAGVEAPTEGRVLLAGQDLAGLDEAARARLRLRHVGLVFQHFNLIPDLTAEENVRLPMTLARRPEARPRAIALLDRVGLAEKARAFPGSLSGGEMQRVAIARAMANEPALILADEPTANLDEANAALVLRMLAELGTDGRAVLVASHDSLALRWFPRRARLHEGRLLPLGGDAADDGAVEPEGQPGQPEGRGEVGHRLGAQRRAEEHVEQEQPQRREGEGEHEGDGCGEGPGQPRGQREGPGRAGEEEHQQPGQGPRQAVLHGAARARAG